MAAIAKLCEYSGEYPGYLMYKYKKNLIQIMPEYRKLFKGKVHTLYIFNPTVRMEHKRSSGWKTYNSNEWKWDDWNPPFKSENEFKEYILRCCPTYRFVNHFDYMLSVPDLQGRVKGEYFNYTTRLSTMKRKIKRLLGCRTLNIIRIDMGVGEWLDFCRRGD